MGGWVMDFHWSLGHEQCRAEWNRTCQWAVGRQGSDRAQGSPFFSLGLCCGVSPAAPEAWQVCPLDPSQGPSKRSAGTAFK